MKYWAFISYSSADRETAAWLIEALESYRIPGSLVGRETKKGPVPNRIYPVFRDRDELKAAPDLETALEQALANSRYLIVICSVDSARPESWVNREIASFKALGRKDDVLALIFNGEPNASDNPATASRECFPEALRYDVDKEGRRRSERVEPLAADLTREDVKPRVARRKALLKIVAQMIGVEFDDLWQRDSQRRRRRIAIGALSAVALLATFLSLAQFSLNASRSDLSARLAEQATAVLDEAPDLALLLSIAAYRTAPTAAAYGALLTTVGKTRHLVTTFKTAGANVTSLAIRPDQRQMAIASCPAAPCTRSDLFLVDLAGSPVTAERLPLQLGRVSQLLYQPANQQLLAVILETDRARFVKVLVEKVPPTLEQIFSTRAPIAAVGWSEQGATYAVANGSSRETEYKIFEEGRGRRCGGFVEGHVQALAFTSSGDHFAIGSEFSPVHLIDTDDCNSRNLPQSRLTDLAFDSTGRYLSAIMPDGTVTQWDLKRLTDPQTFHLTGSMLNGSLHRFSPHSRYLASQDGNDILIHDLAKRRQIVERLNPASAASLVEETQLRQQLEELQVARLVGHAGEPIQLVFSLDGEKLVSADDRGQVILWSTLGTSLVEALEVDDTIAPSGLPDTSRSPDRTIEARIDEEQDRCSGDYKLDCKRILRLTIRDSQTGETIHTLETEQRGLAAILPIKTFELSFQPGGEILTVGFSEDDIPLTRHTWSVNAGALVERACLRANRHLREEEVGRFIQGWRAYLVESACLPSTM